MVLLLGIILIILGILVFALRGFFGVFPDNWEWVGIVLAGVGLIMAVPNTLQMALGRPKLIAYFNRSSRGQERALVIMLKNLPIESKKVWHRLGFHRDTIQSLEVNFQISEAGSGIIKQPIIQTQIYDHSDGLNKNRVVLPPTYSVGAGITIACWDIKKSVVMLVGDAFRKPLQLDTGKYRIEIAFLIDGAPRMKAVNFIVGDKADDLIWVLPNPDKEDYRIL